MSNGPHSSDRGADNKSSALLRLNLEQGGAGVDRGIRRRAGRTPGCAPRCFARRRCRGQRVLERGVERQAGPAVWRCRASGRTSPDGFSPRNSPAVLRLYSTREFTPRKCIDEVAGDQSRRQSSARCTSSAILHRSWAWTATHYSAKACLSNSSASAPRWSRTRRGAELTVWSLCTWREGLAR